MSNLYHVFGEHIFGEPNPNSKSDCEDEMYDGDECASRLRKHGRCESCIIDRTYHSRQGSIQTFVLFGWR